MSIICSEPCILPLVGFLGLMIFLFYTHRKKPELILSLVLPLPIYFIVGIVLYTYANSIDTYEYAVVALVVMSSFCGLVVLFHSILEFNDKNWMLYIRIISGTILLVNPLILLVPDRMWLIVVSFVVCGIMLGFYGYYSYYQGKKIGLVYLFGSAFFMIFAPIISLAIMELYKTTIQDVIIYRRSDFHQVSCHDVAFVLTEEVSSAATTTSLYIFFLVIIAAIRRNLLSVKLRKRKVIPKEFDEIVQEKKKADMHRKT